MTTAMHQVLLVEDEPGIRGVVRLMLQSANYRVVEADTAARAEIEARTHRPDLLIVDLGLPDGDGLDVIRRVRAWSPVPIIVLSARTMEEQKVAALDAGADDYVAKPFGSPELLARVRAALRRSVRSDAAMAQLCIGRAEVDLTRRTARSAGGELHLTPLEYRVLECLARNPGHDRDAAPAAARGLGPGPRRRHTQPARVYPQPAGKARARPVPAEVHRDGSRSGLSSAPG